MKKSSLNEKCILNTNALLSHGFSRSILCDLERNSYLLIPNLLYEILVNNKSGFIIEDLVKQYSGGNNQNKKTIYDYFEQLVKADLLTFTNFPEYYVPLNTDWDYPGEISNVIIDVNQNKNDLFQFLGQVPKLGCRFIQLRFFSEISVGFIKKIILEIDNSIIESVEIFAPYDSEKSLKGLIKLMHLNYRIRSISLYNAPENAVKYSRTTGFGHVVTVTTDVTGHLSCGVISHHYFTPNISTYTESLAHNSCLNRKISIDADGNIKNCPSMEQSFGNIKDTTLQEALEHPEFKKYWNITKDQIAVCKDCEFRYICTDCRAYLENPHDMYAKPLKCGYNPYTCEWEEWSTNPLKQQAIDFYGMREVLPEFNLKPDYVPPRSNRPSPDSAQ